MNEQHEEQVTPELTLQQEFEQWLRDKNAAIKIWAQAPGGELIQLANIVRPGLGDWGVKFEVAPRNE